MIIMPQSSAGVKWHERLVARISDGAAAQSGHSWLLLGYPVFLVDELEHPLTSLGRCCMLIADKWVIITSRAFRETIAQMRQR